MFPYTLDNYRTLVNQSSFQFEEKPIPIDENIKDMLTPESYKTVEGKSYLIQLTLTKP
jgi:hypothetical protein